MKENLIKGSEIVCKALINEGIDTVFGIPGGAILPLYGTLNKFPEIKHILTRHEHVLAMLQMDIQGLPEE